MPPKSKPYLGGSFSGVATPRTPAYRSRDEEAKALMMKQVSFRDGTSASTVNLAFPDFFVGVRTFSKGSASQGDPDKKVHTPAPLVENPFASVEARNSYGYVSEDAPFVVTVTREFMESNLSHSRDGEIPGVFYDDFDKPQPTRHTLGSINLVFGGGGSLTDYFRPRSRGFPYRSGETYAPGVHSHVLRGGYQLFS